MPLLSSAEFFFKLTFSKNSFRNTTKVSNSLDPDQTWFQTVCKAYQQTKKVAAGMERVNGFELIATGIL